MPSSIDALNLPLQLFALGTALGMASGLIEHMRTGNVDHWSLYIAAPAVALFILGILQTVVRALL